MLDILRQKLSIIECVGQYIKLKKSGLYWWGLCPFHIEKTPSFMVNEEKNIFHCFGCGAHGDIFTFLAKKDNKSFREVVEELSIKYNLPLKRRINLDDYYNILEDSGSFYAKNYHSVASYLADRGIKTETITKFRLGFAPESKCIDYLLSKSYNMTSLKELGLTSMGSLDRMRNRLIIPIIDRQQRIIGFGSRSLDNSHPKYINSVESFLFQKSNHLFNENNLVIGETATIVEGYFDTIKLHQEGFANVVAIMGTSMHPGQLFALFQYVRRINIFLDGDDAGQEAIIKNLGCFLQVVSSQRSIHICQGYDADPDELITNFPKHYVQDILDSGRPLEQWILENVLPIPKTGDNQSEARFLESIDKHCALMKDQNLSKIYKKFWIRNKFPLMNQSAKPLVPEAQIIGYLCKYPDLIEGLLENLMNIYFQNSRYEKIRLYIIDALTIENKSCDVIGKEIQLKYGKTIQTLLYSIDNFYRIYDMSLVRKYLLDLMNFLPSNNNF